MSDITINVKAPSVNVNATPQSNVIAPKMQMIRGGSVTVDDELSLTSENPVQNKVVTAALNEKADIITDTASGSIASFPDGADGLPVKSLVCNIEPVQDLNGYENPWPPGGGKNKLPSIDSTKTINGVTWTLNTDGSVNLSGIASANSVYDFGRDVVTLPAGTYTTFDTSIIGVYTVTLFKLVNGSASALKAGGGEFQLTEATSVFMRYVVLSGTTVNTTIHPQIESGSTATTYSPYSNICPISGHTGMTVMHSGADMSNPETLPISWESEAGTVYGGTLAINQDGSCDLTVADANIASYNGETLPSTWISDRDVYAEGTTPTIGAQVVYKLATPTVYHLPSVTMLKTLLGTNNIWADIGDVEVKYPADTKLYIDNLIASLSS